MKKVQFTSLVKDSVISISGLMPYENITLAPGKTVEIEESKLAKNYTNLVQSLYNGRVTVGYVAEQPQAKSESKKEDKPAPKKQEPVKNTAKLEDAVDEQTK